MSWKLSTLQNFIFSVLVAGNEDEEPTMWTFSSMYHDLVKADGNLLVFRHQMDEIVTGREPEEIVVDLKEKLIRKRPEGSYEAYGEVVARIL